MKLKNKVCLVTGSSRGIGRATALELAKEGASVAVNYLKSEDHANSVVAEIRKLGSQAIAIKCDVSKEEQVKNMIDFVIKKFGRLDVLVNNSGIVYDIPFQETTLEQWQRTLDVDLTGVYLCCKHAADHLKKHQGKIVNISSTNGIFAYGPGSIGYNAAKAGVINFTKSLALELAPQVMVNCVAPGWVDTDMNSKLPEKFVQEEKEKIFVKRFAGPDEIAKVVAFLASDDASFVNGSTIIVDGGYP